MASRAVSIPDTSRRTSTDASRRTSLSTTTAAPLSSSNRFTRSSSVSKLPAADFKLNLTNALVKKLSSCHRKDPFLVTETGGGFRFYFQAGFFEIFKACLGSCFKAIAPSATIRDSPDACGKVYTTTYSVDGAYTLSLYMADRETIQHPITVSPWPATYQPMRSQCTAHRPRLSSVGNCRPRLSRQQP